MSSVAARSISSATISGARKAPMVSWIGAFSVLRSSSYARARRASDAAAAGDAPDEEDGATDAEVDRMDGGRGTAWCHATRVPLPRRLRRTPLVRRRSYAATT